MKINHLCATLIIILFIVSCTKDEITTSSWQKINFPKADGNPITSIAFSGENIFTVVSNIGNKIYSSSDNGLNWEEAAQTPYNVNSVVAFGNYIFAGTSRGVYRSGDNGASWSPKNNSFPLFYGVVCDGLPFVNSNMLYCYYSDSYLKTQIFTSDNYGENWDCLTTNLDDGVQSFTILGTSYIATTSTGVQRSTDNGISWTIANSQFNKFNLLIASNTNIIGGTAYGLFYSADNGLAWNKSKIKDNSYQSPDVTCLAMNGNNLYAGTRNGVYHSSDYGVTWTTYNSGFEIEKYGYTIYSLALSSGYLYAGTSHGLYKIRL